MTVYDGLVQGDCREVLKTLPAQSYDSCVTDPPYGLGFMGREWDTFKPDVSREMRDRTVKNHKAAVNPNLKGRLQWAGGAAVEYDYSAGGLVAFQDWTTTWAREVYRVLKPGAHLIVCGAPRTYHRMACGLEDAGFEIRDCVCWLFGQGFPKSKQLGEGRGTALKPAYEPIALARKPFAGTTTATVAEFGTGGLNIDACRLPPDAQSGGDRVGEASATSSYRDRGVTNFTGKGGSRGGSVDGRWPANVILDEEAAKQLDRQSGKLKSGTAVGGLHRRSNKTANCYGRWKGEQNEGDVCYGDIGGASRFFYCPKVSRAEREFGCENLPIISAGDATGGRKEGSAGLNNPRAGAGRSTRSHNAHPTVKPIALMQWLVRLVTPVDGGVLDPFVGSGSTGIAADLEYRDFLGIDQEAQWLVIANARMHAWRQRAEGA